MRCAIVSRAGQTLANGYLVLYREENGDLRLDLKTEGGRWIQGGIVDPDGDMTAAGQVLARQFFEVWGMSDLMLMVTLR